MIEYISLKGALKKRSKWFQQDKVKSLKKRFSKFHTEQLQTWEPSTPLAIRL